MSSGKKILIAISLMVLVSFSLLAFWERNQEKYQGIGSKWWVLYFENPHQANNADFTVENYMKNNEDFTWEAFVNGEKFSEGSFFIASGNRKTIKVNFPEGFHGSKIYIKVKKTENKESMLLKNQEPEEEKEIYKIIDTQ